MSFYSKDVADRVLRILQAGGQVDKDRLTAVLAEVGNKSGAALEKLVRDGLDEDLLLTVLSRAYALRRKSVTAETIQEEAFKALPLKFIENEQILPLVKEGRFLRVGIMDPTKATLAGQIKALTNFNIEFFIIKLTDFEACMEDTKVKEYLASVSEKEAPPKPKAAAPARRKRAPRYDAADPSLVAPFCDDILQSSIDLDVSDIHIEPYRESARVRFRINGVLVVQDQYSDYLFENYLAVITRFKILADCDISEKRLPQDGAITFRTKDGEDVDTRFNVLPGKNGERIVIRLLKGDPSLSIEKIGFTDSDLQKLIEAITSPQGMVLVTGPTGSGKTTTLYGALQYINDPAKNIMTAEDPVEYYLEGLGQVQANEKIGLTFNSILRAFLRQDPEVILVGEIRDQETVEIAVKAALTGHLLLSTLHTNDSIATITRLTNMGVPNFMISAALSLVVAQRLARKNCQNCLVPDPSGTYEALKFIGFTEEEIPNIQARKGSGCAQCDGSGYKGRQGIYEVLRVTPDVEEAILRNAQAPEILEAARSDGFLTMQEVARTYIQDGVICVEEYTRVLAAH
ncbi:MAG: GspE/PulE family protein [Parvibaculales bacterium]